MVTALLRVSNLFTSSSKQRRQQTDIQSSPDLFVEHVRSILHSGAGDNAVGYLTGKLIELQRHTLHIAVTDFVVIGKRVEEGVRWSVNNR